MILDLIELTRLHEAGTPGPWSPDHQDVRAYYTHHNHRMAYASSVENAALIAAARNALPQLLAEVRAGRRWLEAEEEITPTEPITDEAWEKAEAARSAYRALVRARNEETGGG